jgi:hypothetical protein
MMVELATELRMKRGNLAKRFQLKEALRWLASIAGHELGASEAASETPRAPRRVRVHALVDAEANAALPRFRRSRVGLPGGGAIAN